MDKRALLLVMMLVCIAVALNVDAANLDYTTGAPGKSSNVTPDVGAIAMYNDGNLSNAQWGVGGSTTSWQLGGYVNLTFGGSYMIHTIGLVKMDDATGVTTNVTLNVYAGETLVNASYVTPDFATGSTNHSVNFTFAPVNVSSVRIEVIHWGKPGFGGLYMHEFQAFGNNDSVYPPVPDNIYWGVIQPINNSGWNPTGNMSINTTINTTKLANVTLYINNTANFTITDLNGTNTPVNFSVNLTSAGRYDYYFNATIGSNTTISPRGYFYIDTAAPTITIEPDNFFTTTNYSTQSPYDNNITINITYTDDRELYTTWLVMARSNGSMVWGGYFDMTGTTNNTVGSLGIGNLSEDTYTFNITVWDSHTTAAIDEYAIIKKTDELVYGTAEGNIISIKAEGATAAETEKLRDRYDFTFTYDEKTLRDTLVYTVWADPNQKIDYRPGSGYKAHFVVFNRETQEGNWIDFEGIDAKSYDIVKTSDTEYRVTFNLGEKKTITEPVTFSSVGALNSRHESYSWYRGENTTFYNPTALMNTTELFALQLSNSSTISNLTARFFYNNVEQNTTWSANASSFMFNVSMTAPAVVGTHIYNWSWNISMLQADATVVNMSFTGNQTVVSGQVNVSFFDERNLSLINYDTLNVYIVESAYSYTTTTGYLWMGNLSPGVNYIEAESDVYARRGYYVTLTNYSIMQINAYLLSTASPAQEVRFTVQDSDYTRLDRVKLTFYKLINTTYVTIAQVSTDFAGQAALYLDSSVTYRIVIDASSYSIPLKTIDLRPLLTSYTIKLDSDHPGFQNYLGNLSYSITPQQRVFNVSNTPVNKTLFIYSPDGDLEYFGVRLFGHNYTCIPASCVANVTGSPSGGSVGVAIIGNVSGRFKISIFAKRVGFDEFELERDVAGDPTFVEALATISRSLWKFLKQEKSTRSMIMQSVIAVFATIALIGTAAELGIVGLPLIVITAFGIGFFTIMGYIPYVVGFITIILGGLVYAKFGGGAD